MPGLWALDELKGVDLNDKRLDERLTHLPSDLGERPTPSIPAACGGAAETTAAYRFFDNDKAALDGIPAPHRAQTQQRSCRQSVALLLRDTTEIDPTRPQQQGLAEMIRVIARLGGYVNRPNRTDPPGPQTVWIGRQRTHDLAWAWEIFGPEARKKDVENNEGVALG